MDPSLLLSLWAVTADNATSNPALIQYLHENLQEMITDAMAEIIPSEASQFPVRFKMANKVILFRCFVHMLQLAIKERLSKCPVVDVAIGRFRDIVKKISDSPKLREALFSICTSLKVTPKIPELDCETSWNSTWAMMKSVIDLEQPLAELLHRIRQRLVGYTGLSIRPGDDLSKEIHDFTWNAVKDFCRFLAPSKKRQF
jgi:hypothetical protein